MVPNTYRRAIYKADIEYVDPNPDPNGESRNLKVYMTYKIQISNNATNLKSKVQKVVDYYDSRYTLKSIGKNLDNQRKVVDLIDEAKVTYDSNYNLNGYSKLIIDTSDTIIDSQQNNVLYLEFELNQQAVLSIMNGNVTLKNVAELQSYSTFNAEGEIYAGFDEKSVPGNAIPDDMTTYEDDTDNAPSLVLEIADARQVRGKVFEDATPDDLLTGQIRQGNGQYDAGEIGIKGVVVTLEEQSGSGTAPYKTKTIEEQYDKYGFRNVNGVYIPEKYEDSEAANYEYVYDNNIEDIKLDVGDFLIVGYIPGDYKLTYTWGDGEHPVQTYKGTVYSRDRYNTNVANAEWYKSDVDTRFTDATDTYQTRETIDSQISKEPIEPGEKITNMDSTTPNMKFGVEYESTTTASNGDRYVYEVKNIDFGIAERPRQALEIDKKIDNIKVKLGNEVEVVNAELDENGNLQGQTNKLAVYLQPSVNENGRIKIELDSEDMQSAQVTVDYVITVKNKSELDYISEAFYTYGEQTGDAVTITPKGVYDYLDNELATQDNEWVTKELSVYNSEVGKLTITEFRDKVSSIDIQGGTVTSMAKEYQYYKMTQQELQSWYDEIQTKRVTGLGDKIILYNSELIKPLKAGEENTVTLQASKMLANSNEFDLNNQVEITSTEQNGGSMLNVTKTEYESSLHLIDNAESVVITEPTGENRNYATIISIAVSTLAILGAGIVLIKKKILQK